MSISQEELDSALNEGFAERALEAFVDRNFVIPEATDAIDLIDSMDPMDPEMPLSEELSPEGINFLVGLSQAVLDCMESLRPGALSSRERILKDMPREV